jgi:hypothetical protein
MGLHSTLVLATTAIGVSAVARVDPSTLVGKLVVGYQGWQTTPSDGAAFGWEHWSNNRADVPGAGTVHFDACKLRASLIQPRAAQKL